MTDSELPDFVDRDVLRDISTVEVPDEALLQCFLKANKPFLSKSAVAEMTDLSDEGTRQRLNSLAERGVLLSAEAGKQTKIYWLNDPRSSWPVPDDLDSVLSESPDRIDDRVERINRVTTFTVLYGSVITSLYLLEWLSGLPMTDGVFEVALGWSMMPILVGGLLAVVFYVALQTSLLVENEDAWWPTIRRVYRRLA
jgi:hypothetical protein